MPICPRLSNRIYPKLSDIVKASNEFAFFGTYSINVKSGIVKAIIQQKNDKPNLYVAALLPPPTDFILYDFSVRKQILQAYGLTSLNQIEFAQVMATNPVPAYSVLENVWRTRRPNGSQSALLAHLEKIAQLYSDQVIVLLEPNMHAKFVVTESEAYEGSGNLTYSGLRVNVEVYNFYKGGAYWWAASSYIEFLSEYLSRMTNWQYGSNYVDKANELGTRVAGIADRFQVKFNPRVYTERIEQIVDAYEQLLICRSNLWSLPGHELLSKVDFSLSVAENNAQSMIAKLWSLNNQEIEKELSVEIMKRLEVISTITKKAALTLKEASEQMPQFKSAYEQEYGQRIIKTAEGFRKYLTEKSKEHRNFRNER
jgi:molybdopterin-binding protein